MHLMYFKTAIIIQMASSLVMGASSSSILGAFFCHGCGNAWVCSQPDEVSWAPPVHFHPDRKPDIPTRISDSLLAEVDFVGHKTMFSRPGFFKPLSPGLEEVAGNGIH